MKLLRYLGYFRTFAKTLGMGGAAVFAFDFGKAVFQKDRTMFKLRFGGRTLYCSALEDCMGRIMEIFIQETYALEATEDPIRVIDGGANIGVALLYIKIQAPQSRVLCFEPNPATRAILEKNVAANKWQNSVTVIPYALGAEEKAVEFYVEVANPTSSSASILPGFAGAGRKLSSYTVEMKRLSVFVTAPIDFLKIDIEGAELRVLEDLAASGTIAQIKAIQLEYHYVPGILERPLSAVVELLEQAGFEVKTHNLSSLSAEAEGKATQAYMVYAAREIQKN